MLISLQDFGSRQREGTEGNYLNTESISPSNRIYMTFEVMTFFQPPAWIVGSSSYLPWRDGL